MTSASFLEKRRWALWTVFAVVFFTLFALRAAHRTLWFDELFTYYVSVQPTFSDVIDRLHERLDQHPPLFYLLQRAALLLGGDGEPLIAFRLPGMLAVFGGLWCLFEIVRRRHADLYAWIAVFLVLNSFVVKHAVEARPYGLVFGFCALAALAYLRAQDSPYPKAWLAVLGLGLFGSVSVCYYAVLAFFPFALAEAVRIWERRRLDWGMLAALGAPLLLSAVYAPLALSNVSRFRPVNWATPTLGMLRQNYTELLQGVPEAGAFLLIGWGLWLVFGGKASSEGEELGDPSRSYVALALGFVLLPVVLFVVAKLVTHKMHPRYVIEASIGVAVMAASVAAALLHRRPALLGLGVVLALAGRLAFQQGLPIYWEVLYPRPEPQLARWLEYQPPDLPVVVDNPMVNLELAHENPRGIRDRLFYLVDPENAQRLAPLIVNGGETWRKSQRHMPIQAPEREDFIADNPEFLLYYSSFGMVDYVLKMAREEGAGVELLNFRSTDREVMALYRVRYSSAASEAFTEASTR